MTGAQTNSSLDLMPGDIVEVRGIEEILSTLDARGELDGLPFMPEMTQFCGQRFTVYRRADKTCDTIDNTGALRMRNAVHLTGTRCDGARHGGCQADCLLFWKESWLRRPESSGADTIYSTKPNLGLQDLDRIASIETRSEDGEVVARYRCQATELKRATTPMHWWDPRQYIRDVRTGNATIADLARAATLVAYRRLVGIGIGYGYLIRFYDWFQSKRNGQPFPYRQGLCSGKTPTGHLDLKVGELVRVRSHREILETLDQNSKNRGLWFDAEMVPYCGKILRVAARVNRIINEKTGEMMELKNPCIVLEGVYCMGRYTRMRMFCPRSIPSYWREIWLERLDSDQRIPPSSE